MKILFICNQGQNRSKTAAEFFKDRFKTKSAGLYNDKPITKQQLAWADTIMVMEDKQRSEIAKQFPDVYLQKRILSVNILDVYQYNQHELIDILKSRVKELADYILLSYNLKDNFKKGFLI